MTLSRDAALKKLGLYPEGTMAAGQGYSEYDFLFGKPELGAAQLRASVLRKAVQLVQRERGRAEGEMVP